MATQQGATIGVGAETASFGATPSLNVASPCSNPHPSLPMGQAVPIGINHSGLSGTPFQRFAAGALSSMQPQTTLTNGNNNSGWPGV